MSDVLSRELPAPKRWQELESLAFDVYRRLWKTTDIELHGRTGQPQAGVDVYGTNRVEQLFTGVQCKGKDGDYGGVLTEAELRAEVEKALTFQPPLQAYIILTTAPNDVAIQKVARDISIEHAKAGLFEVRVTGWDTFRHYIADYQDLLTKYFRDFAPVDVIECLKSASQEQAQNIARVESMLRAHGRIISDIRDDKAGGDQLASRVAEISRLIGDGFPKAAIKALDRLLVEESKTASSLAMYRILASKGNAHLALGEEGEAISLFRQAHQAHPEFINARATLAMAHLLEGDRAKAFELASDAFKEDPSSARTAGIFIEAAPDGMSITDLEARLSPDLLDNVEIKLHLAVRARTLEHGALHRRFAEEALAKAPDDWRALSAVAEALMQPLEKLDGLALTHALPEEYKADVERALKLTASAWSKLVQRDSTFQGRHVAMNLISLLGLAGQDEEASNVLDEALKGNPKYAPLVERAAQRSASAGNWASAAAAIDVVPENELSFDGLLLRTQAAFALGDVSTASACCDRLEIGSNNETSLPERDELIAALRVKVAILNGADRITAVEDAVRANPSSIVLRSILFDDLTESDPLRARLADEIRNLAGDNLSLRERVHAAETLYAAGKYSLAADLYAPLHARSDSHALKRRLQALHLADRRAEARKLFESLPQDLRSSPRYLSLGINIYERAGLLNAALALVEKALEVYDVLRNRLAWIQLLVRLGRQEQIIPWLKQVQKDIEGTPDELMRLARIIDQYLGRDRRALTIGYRALRAGYNKPQMHLEYAIGLIINGRPDDDALIAPTVVETGTGVAMLNETTGEMIFRIIETVPDPVIERGELGSDDPFAKRLVGLKVGDSIEMTKVNVATQTYRIIEIQSRFLFAFRRSLRDFSSLFPENPAFGSFAIDESKGRERFADMYALARNRAEYGKEIEAMYRDGALPLPMIAKFTGCDVFELWDDFSQNPTLGLKSAIGIAEEFEVGRSAARRGIIVVDPVSIYAWSRMDVQSILRKSAPRLAVVQSSIDALRQLVEKRKTQRGCKMGTFGWDGE